MSLDEADIFPDQDDEEVVDVAEDDIAIDENDLDNIDELLNRSDALLGGKQNATSGSSIGANRLQKKRKISSNDGQHISAQETSTKGGQGQRKSTISKREEEKEVLRRQVAQQVTEVKQLMVKYHRKDLKAVEKKEPALAKIQHVDEILQKLSKQGVQREFIEQRGLDFLTQWLDKIPNGPEPSVSLRKKLLHFIYELPVQRQHFAGIQLGKVIFRISEKSDVKELKNLASKIVEKWSKILNSKARQSDLDYADEDEGN